MFSLNRVHIIGYQTQPVQIRQIPSGASVTDLNLVVPYTFKSESGEMLNGKGFHTVTLWGPMADVAGQYVRPGAQVFVAGRLQTDSWEDQDSGEKRSKTKIVALDMILLDPKDGQIPTPENASNITNAVNHAEVIGHVTRDPEMRTTTSGHKVLTLGVASNERWKDKGSGETRERTEFHNVVVWGDIADEVQRSIKKGNRVYANGRVQTRSWDAPDGAKRTTTEIIADSISLLGVESAVAKEAVENSAQRAGESPQSVRPASAEATSGKQAQDKQAPAQTPPQASPTAASSSPAEASSPAAAVPSVDYASEVKAEDLPF